MDRLQKYGLTDKFIFDKSQILIVFEVKKKLNPARLSEAMEHLTNITKLCTEDFVEKVDSQSHSPAMNVVGQYYSRLTGDVAPSDYQQIHNIDDERKQMVLFSLLQDSDLPLRIIHSFEGYKKEKGFRKAYLDYVEKTHDSDESWRISVPNTPNLITSGNYAIVKGTGQPYFISADDEIVVTASVSENIARVMLDVIWMKVSRYFQVEMPWGEDLEREEINPLVRAKPVKRGDKIGWGYNLHHEKEKAQPQAKEWSPEKANSFTVDFFHLVLFNGGSVDMKGGGFKSVLRKYKLSRQDAIRQLVRTGVFAKGGEYMMPVYDNLLLANIDEEYFYTHERDRFWAWCDKYELKPFVMNYQYIE
ncbi:MAG: hypothetical protein ACQEUN_17310 [Pseudomonadota bacterium]